MAHSTCDAAALCAFCTETPSVLAESNGLLLDMQPLETHLVNVGDPQAVELQAARLAWSGLKAEFGDLTIVEEALLSPVISCRGVLRLPSGGQLGYTGSFINFVSDVNVVSQQLPRAPHNIGLIIYQAKGAKDTVKLLEVRKAAVEAHLRFFCRHHYCEQSVYSHR